MPGRFNPDDYVDVQDRIVRFWDENPDGAIRTRLESLPDNFEACRYVAKVYKNRDSGEPDATGWAFELAGGNGANSTSHEENCETSAIGRALANMGYATSRHDRPSRQEMQKVDRHDQGDLPARSRTTSQGTIPRDDFAAPENRHPQQQYQQQAQNGSGPQPATPRQLKFIQAIAREHGISDEELDAEVEQLYGRRVAHLDRRDASAFIERLQSRRNVTELAS